MCQLLAGLHTDLTLTTILGGRNYYPYFTDEETGAQRVKQLAERFSGHLYKPLLSRAGGSHSFHLAGLGQDAGEAGLWLATEALSRATASGWV